MKRTAITLALLSAAVVVQAQTLPAGPKVTVSAVTQVAPTVPQYTRIDIPMLREDVPKRSGGRVEVTEQRHALSRVAGGSWFWGRG